MAKIQLIKEAAVSNPYIENYNVYINGEYLGGNRDLDAAMLLYAETLDNAKKGRVFPEILKEEEI